MEHDTGRDSAAAGHDIGTRFGHVVVEDAPPAAIEAIVARFRSQVTARRASTRAVSPWAVVADRVRAVLAFDDWSAGPMVALRGPASPPAGPRHLVYSVASADSPAEVAVSLYPLSTARVSIVGQVLTEDSARRLVEVLVEGRVVGVDACSEHGEFTIEAPVDWDEIVLVGPAGDVVILREDGPAASA